MGVMISNDAATEWRRIVAGKTWQSIYWFVDGVVIFLDVACVETGTNISCKSGFCVDGVEVVIGSVP